MLRSVRQFPDAAGRSDKVLHMRMHQEDILCEGDHGENNVLTEVNGHGEILLNN